MKKDQAMPPFVVAAAAVVAGWAMIRWAYKAVLRVNRELEELRVMERGQAGGEIKTLKQDPVTGAYRPD